MINTTYEKSIYFHEEFLLDCFVITLIREQWNYYITMIYYYYYHCHYIPDLIIELYNRLQVTVVAGLRCVETSSRL